MSCGNAPSFSHALLLRRVARQDNKSFAKGRAEQPRRKATYEKNRISRRFQTKDTRTTRGMAAPRQRRVLLRGRRRHIASGKFCDRLRGSQAQATARALLCSKFHKDEYTYAIEKKGSCLLWEQVPPS